MSPFYPSDYSGMNALALSNEGETSTEGGGFEDLLEQYAPAVSSVLFGGDPIEEAAVTRARIENYRQMYNNASSGFLQNLYAMRINTLTEKLKALEERASESRTAAATTQAGKIGGIVLFGAGALALGLIGFYFYQRAQTERWKRTAR
jgi:hypothetical protein